MRNLERSTGNLASGLGHDVTLAGQVACHSMLLVETNSLAPTLVCLSLSRHKQLLVSIRNGNLLRVR